MSKFESIRPNYRRVSALPLIGQALTFEQLGDSFGGIPILFFIFVGDSAVDDCYLN
jgi:hypothetical protein